jgi:hypothetical protein
MEGAPVSALPSVPQRMETDDAPTAHACTFSRAIRGDDCTFEGLSSHDGDVRANADAVSRAGATACAEAEHQDAALRAQCEREVAGISERMPCARSERLTDEQGFLTAEAEGCVEELRAAVARIGRISSLSRSCCACLAESRCSIGENQCRSELADLSPQAGLRACLSRSCEAACSVFAPSLPGKEKEPDPEPPLHTRRTSYKT